MSASSGKCGTCGAAASFKCSGCNSIFYCEKKHQQEHWPKHRAQCRRAYEIRTTLELGRHLVASRDLEEDDVILTENPFVIGPGDDVKIPNCIGCYAKLPPVSTFFCPGCRWPACSSDCPNLKDPAYHGEECGLLYILSLFYGHQWEVVFPLRLFLLQTRNPKMWQWILERAPYADAKLAQPDLKDDLIRALTHPLTPLPMMAHFNQTINCSFATMRQIFAVKDVCSLRLPEHRTGALVALYPKASLLQHSCSPNIRLLFDIPSSANPAAGVKTGRVTIRAVQSIRRGEILTWAWTCQTHPTTVRRQELADVMNMRCSCPRCNDPTENGTNFGTLKCLFCGGSVLPVDRPQIEGCDWKCVGKCGHIINSVVAHLRFLYLAHDLSEACSTDVGLRRRLVKLKTTFERLLVHPNHYHNVMLKSILLKTYGSLPGSGGVAALSDVELQKKAGTRVLVPKQHRMTSK